MSVKTPLDPLFMEVPISLFQAYSSHKINLFAQNPDHSKNFQ